MSEIFVYNIIYIISNFFSLFIIQKFFNVFYNKEKTMDLLRMGTYSVYFLATSVVYLTINIPWLTLMINIICLFLISMTYQSTFSKRIAAVIFTYMFMFLVEIFVVIGAGILRIDITEKATYVAIGAHVILKILTFMIAVCLNSFKSIKSQKAPAVLQLSASLLVSIISIYLVITILGFKGTSTATAILSTSGLFAINIMLFSLYDILSGMYEKNISAALYKKEKEYYFHECELMKESVDEMAAFKHDIRNHLVALEGMLNHQDDNTKNYLSYLNEKIDADYEYSRCGNVALDSFINYKLRNTKEFNINVNVEVSVPRENFVDIGDLISILGNLIDNALDALNDIDNNRELHLKLLLTKGRLIITVKNTFSGKVSYQNGKILSSKMEHGHGYGLKNIQNILKKYDGTLSINHNSDTFTAIVMMYINNLTENI